MAAARLATRARWLCAWLLRGARLHARFSTAVSRAGRATPSASRPCQLYRKQVANQQIGHGVAQVGIVTDELTEAEAVVVLAHESAHPIDAVVEVVAPAAQLLGADVALSQTVEIGRASCREIV